VVSRPLCVFLAALAAVAAGCSADEPAGVLLHVDAQPFGRSEAASVRVTIWSETGTQAFQQEWPLRGDGPTALPIVVWVRPRPRPGTSTRFLAEAVLLDASGARVLGTARTGEVAAGTLRRALLCIEDGCRFVRCDATDACLEDLAACDACVLGSCASAELELLGSESRPSCPGTASSEAACWNLLDDDGDAEIDCADADCDGRTCDELGNVCIAGACACPTLSATETDCANGINDDCDSPDAGGGLDCDDTDCDGQPCGEHGQVCAGGRCECPAGPGPEIACSDGVDNDCDGAVDCSDLDCADRPCGPSDSTDPSRLVCSGGACVCNTGRTTEASCTDGSDDDCDGLLDCADPDCDGVSCGANGLVCSGGSCRCSRGSAQTCGAFTEDQDCDGLGGCADPDCNGQACWFNGQVCSSGGCVCPHGAAPETACGDGIDNDCDGANNCSDSDCQHQRCGTVNACCGGSCNDLRRAGNCGGCNTSCDSGAACHEVSHSGRIGYVCGCAGGRGCPRGQTCRDFDGERRCSCDGPEDCAADQVCNREAGKPNFCRYRWM
jgi:hypothetical protein